MAASAGQVWSRCRGGRGEIGRGVLRV